ncbi:Mannan polymerase II complex anp1 subunit [Kluyveromyces marxianus]|uniref:Mannan polymerase II complex ANP1 subunit n=2 Tax=Kluyveromyces marxianus TaxID=4911 RepID=W0T8C9_KLUMD|nr:mannan polymerase II complex ANP1 subunit [Kluyveromyces marxianus DMKU3-1042]KAG0673057.1 Mannan polymerase II complex anp1 subunit [Kluyveromyces marxianus]KAG0681832.1 Mannan polymerase II complex anp1 subunit [Kluyveromyces marxianus]QGN13495.1 mannan polymerase II complex ANP1 subunit [Kluyveromyces marxianus]BAO38329.1 mannan polymerase II complex ANP1 subunit [Kluyveromyces marxianus DMKU3-1042]BAP69889.1 mannan polymerase II complex ANP1 subunit [Kluyveromyces marxianus]
MLSKGKNRFTSLTAVSLIGSVVAGFLILRILLPTVLQVVPVVSGTSYANRFRNLPQVEYYDLNNYQGKPNGWQTGDRVLFCVPLRDAAAHLDMFFDTMDKLTYPHNLIDLSFLVSDSSDDTMSVLLSHLRKAQSNQDKTKRFGNIEIFEKDFGQSVGQSFSDRHGFAAQGPRRKSMAKARNWLGSAALKPYHSYVYWRDVDVQTIPNTILEDLMHHDKDVIVPNVWRPLPDWLGNIQPYDLNSWVESEGGLQLADSLDEDACIVEGYPEYATWRTHLAYMRDPSGDPEVEMELDGIGGVSILSKAKVFRTGSHFPAFSFEKHAETEAFGKLSRRMQYSVVGLPHYVIWHIYEPSSDDLKHMAWMAEEEKRRVEEQKIQEFYARIWDIGFDDMRDEWELERLQILKNIDPNVLDRKIQVDWSDDEGNGAGSNNDGNNKDSHEVPLEFDPSH